MTIMVPRRTMLLGFAIAALAACGGGDDASNAADPDAGPDDPRQDGGEGSAPFSLDGHCPEESLVGTFLIEAQEEFSLVDGTVADGVVPVSVLEEVERQGDCRLMRRRNPFCDPPCSAGQTCNFDGACIPFPSNQDFGTITVTGLREPVEMQPLQPGNHYSFTDLPNPAFEPDSEIRLRSVDGRIALDGRGFPPVAPGEARWTIAGSEPLEVTWDAPTAGADTRVMVRINIDQHGNSPINLVCDLPDTGSAEIPASLVDALLVAGVSGFPNGRIARGTTDSMEVADGCVELRVSSPRAMAVRVAGHIPCDDETPCPQAQTCDLTSNTCR